MTSGINVISALIIAMAYLLPHYTFYAPSLYILQIAKLMRHVSFGEQVTYVWVSGISIVHPVDPWSCRTDLVDRLDRQTDGRQKATTRCRKQWRRVSDYRGVCNEWYTFQISGSSFDRIMACYIFGVTSLLKPWLTYCQVDTGSHLQWKLNKTKKYSIRDRKLKLSSPKWQPFWPVAPFTNMV